MFTKKEWTNNRSFVASNSGVGKCLDTWQKNCPTDFRKIVQPDKVSDRKKAMTTAKELEKALGVARKKCNSRLQKETINGIDLYLKKINRYKEKLEELEECVKAREAITNGIVRLGVALIAKDPSLRNAFTQFLQSNRENKTKFDNWEALASGDPQKSKLETELNKEFKVKFSRSEVLSREIFFKKKKTKLPQYSYHMT